MANLSRISKIKVDEVRSCRDRTVLSVAGDGGLQNFLQSMVCTIGIIHYALVTSLFYVQSL